MMKRTRAEARTKINHHTRTEDGDYPPAVFLVELQLYPGELLNNPVWKSAMKPKMKIGAGAGGAAAGELPLNDEFREDYFRMWT